MKLKLILLCFFSCFIQKTNSQNFTYISLKNETSDSKQKLGFKNFIIIDARQDSSKVGYYSSDNVHMYELSFKNGLSSALTVYLNNYYKNAFTDSDYSVLIVLKKLWISQFDTTLTIGNNLTGSGKIIIEKLKIEFYIKNKSNYYPLLRVDSSFFTTQRNSRRAFGSEIADGISSCCDRLFSIDIPHILQKKKYNLSQVQEFSNQLLDKPILHTIEYKKGIYKTFDEFLKAEPSMSYKSINKKKYGDVLFLDDGTGNEYPSNKFWGYSDGKDIYIISGKNFFKLNRVQNTFEFFGIKNLLERFDYDSNSGSGPGSDILNLTKPFFGSGRGSITHKRKPAMDYFFYQVDMETGAVY
jgi:hypothetical protein